MAIPAGWTEHVDAGSGKTYYFNASTQVTLIFGAGANHFHNKAARLRAAEDLDAADDQTRGFVPPLLPLFLSRAHGAPVAPG